MSDFDPDAYVDLAAAALVLAIAPDVIVTPATPCVAPVIGSPSVLIGGVEHPTGPISLDS